MDEGPTFVERVPQVFSIALGVCGTAAGLAWDQSRPLAIVAVAGAIASLFLRVWVPLRRRRKHGH